MMENENSWEKAWENAAKDYRLLGKAEDKRKLLFRLHGEDALSMREYKMLGKQMAVIEKKYKTAAGRDLFERVGKIEDKKDYQAFKKKQKIEATPREGVYQQTIRAAKPEKRVLTDKEKIGKDVIKKTREEVSRDEDYTGDTTWDRVKGVVKDVARKVFLERGSTGKTARETYAEGREKKEKEKERLYMYPRASKKRKELERLYR